MANEFSHASVGTTMTQAEFEAVGLHVCNSQATGDLIYASSATQLSRLAIGAADTVLTCNGTIPSWSATPTLNTAVAKGIWTASGTWALPAFTLGGTVSGGAQTLANIGGIEVGSNGIYSVSNASYYYIRGGQLEAGSGAFIYLFGKTGGAGAFGIGTPNAAENGDVSRLSISGNLATAVATWTNITHTGLVLGGNMTVSAYNLVTDTTTGTKIATAAGQKLGFFGATPRVQCAKASFNNWAAFGDVVNALVALGLFDVA